MPGDKTAGKDAGVAARVVSGEHSTRSSSDNVGGIGVVDMLRVLGGVLLLSGTLSYFVTGESISWGWRPWWSRPGNVAAWWGGPIRLTDEELAAYDGTDPSKPIYVALNGSIYDVSAGSRLYGPGGSYHFFAGHDGARAYVTGCFATDVTPDVRGVEDMYVPLDLDVPNDAPTADRREAKLLREQASRKGRENVRRAIAGWQRTFGGATGKPYFWVGEVVREEGWLERLPKRQLCDAAKKARPKTTKKETGRKEDKYRSGI